MRVSERVVEVRFGELRAVAIDKANSVRVIDGVFVRTDANNLAYITEVSRKELGVKSESGYHAAYEERCSSARNHHAR